MHIPTNSDNHEVGGSKAMAPALRADERRIERLRKREQALRVEAMRLARQLHELNAAIAATEEARLREERKRIPITHCEPRTQGRKRAKARPEKAVNPSTALKQLLQDLGPEQFKELLNEIA